MWRAAEDNPVAQAERALGRLLRLQDLTWGGALGEGYACRVLRATLPSGAHVAVKASCKTALVHSGRAEGARRERSALAALSSPADPGRPGAPPFMLRLYATFQDDTHIYLVLSLAEGGSLEDRLSAEAGGEGGLTVACVRFYCAELICALEHLRALGIVHRDIKPANLLLDGARHLLLADFGACKILPDDAELRLPPDIPEEELEHGLPDEEEEEEEEPQDEQEGAQRGRRTSFKGSPQYMSPEVLRGRRVSPATDLWALGCLIFALRAGNPPFQAESEQGEWATFQRVLSLRWETAWPGPPALDDAVRRLLRLNPARRLAAADAPGPYASLRSHALFRGLSFDALNSQQPPPIARAHPDEDIAAFMSLDDDIKT